ncbi:PAS domain-containing hybrid sensor histidine kinase/response regulator [Pelagicoccus albus]|uniref:Sensory/regulatory protein RpfC n=1 Tax=Pelagicoccus albus TaxID=415222 RepID=A0A7X1B869_9BACT|nr:response regulator [Pelagicoccus albus]MBC2607351.1 response regulator [Pelagicoccus albus]
MAALVGLGSFLTAQVKAQDSVETQITSSSPEKISGVGQFWHYSQLETHKHKPLELDLTLDVLHYDPEWGNLWVRNEGIGAYLPLSGTPLEFASGNKIRMRGTMVPSLGLKSETLSIEVIEENTFPEPKLYSGKDADFSNADLQFAKAQGYVDRILFEDETHLAYDFIVGGQRLELRVLLEDTNLRPQIVGSFVSASGVIVLTRNSDPTLNSAAIWCDASTGLATAPELEEKISQAPRINISQLAEQKVGELVSLPSLVYSKVPEQPLIVRDETGQIAVSVEQESELERGDSVELFGYTAKNGAEWTLENATYRPINDSQIIPQQADSILHQFRLVEQVLELPLAEQSIGHSADLSGVLTYVDPHSRFVYLQDSTGGIRVNISTPLRSQPFVGESISVKGKIQEGNFTPEVVAESLQIAGYLPIPKPVKTNYEEAISGSLDSQWVQISAYLEEVEYENDWSHLLLSTPHGDFRAKLYKGDAAFEVGDTLELNGVLVTEVDKRKYFKAIHLYIPEQRFVRVAIPSLKNPFDLPLTDITSLRAYQAIGQANQYRHIQATVAHHDLGQTIYLNDGRDSLRVLSHTNQEFLPGDKVQVVGIPQRSSTGLYFRNAKIQKIGDSEALAPLYLGKKLPYLNLALDGQLISVEAKLVDTAVSNNQIRLFLQSGDSVIEASGKSSNFEAVMHRLIPGAKLGITGIYYIVFDEHSLPAESSILLRGENDVDILKYAPWWTPGRIGAALFICFAAVVAGGLWSLSLRRVIRTQTETIRQKAESERLLESQHQELIRNVSDFIYTLDFEGNFLSFNEAGEELTGYTQAESKSINIFALLGTRHALLVRNILRKGRYAPTMSLELQIHRKDGSPLWVEVNCGFVRKNKEAVYAFGIMRDIDARKQVEAELTRAKEKAEENTRAKSAFLATMSHELRTPMNGIIGMTDLLLGLELNKEAKEYSETIRDSANSLLVLLNDILDLSKAEAGKLTLDPHPFNLAEAIHQTTTLLGTTAKTKGIDLRSKVTESIPLELMGDAGKLRQVLLNLLGNAIKFTEQGFVSLKVELEDDAEDKLTYRFNITDTGIGIPPAAQTKLFNSFVQADNSHARRFGGTGLGLKISQEIVQLLGGEIGLESTEGQGSLFWFTAVFNKTSQQELPDTKEGKRKKKKLRWTGPAIKILVAEDMPINQKVTLLQLKKLGLDADLAEDGFQVLEMVKKKRYDVIFMDCQMPGMDGFEAAEKLRESRDNDRIFITALTANAMTGDRERCMEAGMDDYVAKPTRPDKLLKSLLKSIESSSESLAS